MISKDLIKVLRKERKATICIKINGIVYPVDNVEFSYTSDDQIFISLEPKDIAGNLTK